jgi:hypothetical protein
VGIGWEVIQISPLEWIRPRFTPEDEPDFIHFQGDIWITDVSIHSNWDSFTKYNIIRFFPLNLITLYIYSHDIHTSHIAAWTGTPNHSHWPTSFHLNGSDPLPSGIYFNYVYILVFIYLRVWSRNQTAGAVWLQGLSSHNQLLWQWVAGLYSEVCT